jgi:hypothetical protein
VVSFTPWPLYPQGKSPCYPLDRRLGGPQSRSGRGGEENITKLSIVTLHRVWSSRFRFPAGAGNFSLHYCVQNGSGAHPASYRMGTRGSFPGGKEVGA